MLIPRTVRGERAKMLFRLAQSIPGAKVFREYKPCKVLLLYGWGGDRQQQAIRAHKGRYACFDLGYWHRQTGPSRHWRVSIDGWHCPDIMGINADSRRFDRYKLKVHRNKYNPNGPILVIGNSAKSGKVGARNWSRDKVAEIRRQTSRPVWYKPKPGRPPEPGVDADRVVIGDINDVLPKVSMVVCRHSNVTVDAALLGVPAVCEDGAGAMIYPRALGEPQPSYEDRLTFLHQVAWWQWSTKEIVSGDCWHWLYKQLKGSK